MDDDFLVFATRPGVVRVTVDGVFDYGLSGPANERLQSLGNGWHASDSGFGLYQVGPRTLRAYDASGKLLDTVTETYTAAPPTPSGG